MKTRGFSLIELMVVVAIILIIAAIAIPNLNKARVAANEASAIGTLRTLNMAAVTYQTNYDNGFPPDFAHFGGVIIPGSCDLSGLMDNTLVTTGVKSGYTFTYTASQLLSKATTGCAKAGARAYVANAVPLRVHATGNDTFCTDESGVIHVDASGGAAQGSDATCELLPSAQN